MNMRHKSITRTSSELLALMFVSIIAYSQSRPDIVHGNLIQFNDNGLWCWFQDERVIVDSAKMKIVLGTDASGIGTGGSPRNGADEAVIFDVATQTPQRYILHQWSTNCDDHNSAGFLVRPDGKYIAMYDQHYDNYVTRYSIFGGTSWSAEQTYDWRTKPGGIDYTLAYNNVYYLSAESRMYDFQRANHRSPNFLVSSDMGNTWTWGGQLTTNSSNSYNKGYYKYWSNGVDRIDFVFTEQHPRDTLTSIYHGYITGGKAYRSDGTLVDSNIFDTTFIPTYLDFTKVFGDSTLIGNIRMRRCWQSDLVRYDDGTIATIITARTNQYQSPPYPDNAIDPDHEFVYCRYDGSQWSYTYLGKAGHKLYAAEGDYTGLACLCPNDPNTLYISTPRDPRDTTIFLAKREIFKGVTSDHGASWSWTPITENSERDNLRPTVPAWDANHMVLVWCRGTYGAAQSFDAAAVGIVDSKAETFDKSAYVDATPANTALASGASLVTTGPDSNAGPADNKWHERMGYGNGGYILTSSEVSGEDAPTLVTRVRLPAAGTYNVWVDFWGSAVTGADWRIKAGLSANTMQTFRQMASRAVDSADYSNAPVVSGMGGSYLYQALVGRVQVATADSFSVYVDDNAVRTGSTSLTGDVARTWYDGVSYARVNGAQTAPLAVDNAATSLPSHFALARNYPNPFNPSTTIGYDIPKNSPVKIVVYDILGREIATLVNRIQNAGYYSVRFDAANLTSGVYFYSLQAGGRNFVQKMVVLK